MKKVVLFSLMGLTLLLSACAPAKTPNNTPLNGNNANMMSGTPTPGSMREENPEAAHMMEPITAPNLQPATEA